MNGRFEGQTIGVVGLGKTGLSACRYLHGQGAKIRVSDSKAELDAESAAVLKSLNAELYLGGHPPAFFAGLRTVMVSPGVPLSSAPLVEAAKAGVKLVGDLECVWPALKAPVVVIGGTNGKSTATTLVGEFLKASGKSVFVGGNLGTPVFEAADKPFDVIVFEVSSYQCETVEKFRPKVSVLLNITEDHLDRYPTFEDYAAAKFRVFSAMQPEDWAVLSADDPIILRDGAKLKTGKVWFSANGRELPGDGIRMKEAIGRFTVTGDMRHVDFSVSPLKGIHNRENLAAAVLAARLMGADWDSIKKVIREFKGLRHRCELVRVVDGVSFYNDSKATNVGAVVRALEGFAGGPGGQVILLVGGVEKGGSYQPIRDLLGKIVRSVVTFGSSRERLSSELKGTVPVESVETLPEAVRLAKKVSKSGDTVLLAPACSSFDQFRNYAHRGEVFEQEVARL